MEERENAAPHLRMEARPSFRSDFRSRQTAPLFQSGAPRKKARGSDYCQMGFRLSVNCIAKTKISTLCMDEALWYNHPMKTCPLLRFAAASFIAPAAGEKVFVRFKVNQR
jgi:hypothetical protein